MLVDLPGAHHLQHRRPGVAGPARSPRRAARSGSAPTTTACRRPVGVPAVDRTGPHRLDARGAASSGDTVPAGASQHAAVVAAPAGRRVQGIPVRMVPAPGTAGTARTGAVRRGEHLGDPVDDTPAQGRDLTLDGRTPRHQRGSANSTAPPACPARCRPVIDQRRAVGMVDDRRDAVRHLVTAFLAPDGDRPSIGT